MPDNDAKEPKSPASDPTEVRAEKIGPGHPPKDFRFKPGKEWRGNAGGRPKQKPLTDALRRILDGEVAPGVSGHDVVAAEMLNQIVSAKSKPSSKIRAFEEAANRLEGRPAQTINLEQPMDEHTMKIIADLATRLLPEEVILAQTINLEQPMPKETILEGETAPTSATEKNDHDKS